MKPQTSRAMVAAMNFSRRDFLKSSTVLCASTILPSWVEEMEAEEATKVNKQELAEAALSHAKSLGASYADIRVNRYRRESLFTREHQVQNVSRTQDFGFGIRVLIKGAWGFASSYNTSAQSVRDITAKACAIAKANAAFQRKPVEMVATPKVVANWKSSFQTDPFDVPIDRKVGFLLELNETALKTKGASFVSSSLGFQNEQKFFASTDGSRIEQYIIRTIPNFSVTAVDKVKGDFQSRTSLAGAKCIGFEYIESHPWQKEAEAAGEEAVAKL